MPCHTRKVKPRCLPMASHRSTEPVLPRLGNKPSTPHPAERGYKPPTLSGSTDHFLLFKEREPYWFGSVGSRALSRQWLRFFLEQLCAFRVGSSAHSTSDVDKEKDGGNHPFVSSDWPRVWERERHAPGKRRENWRKKERERGRGGGGGGGGEIRDGGKGRVSSGRER